MRTDTLTALLATFLLLFFVSCRNNVVYESGIEFEKGWHKDSNAVFNVFIPDTAKIMDFILKFRHTDDYHYRNLWIFASVQNIENNTVQIDTLELYMSYKDGRWFGKKKGKNYDISTYYKHAVKLAHPGNYRFEFRQGMRVDNLEGINKVSFIVADR